MKLFRHEIYKLSRDIQFRVCAVVLWVYSIFGFLTSVNRTDFFTAKTVSSFLQDYTDPVLLLILVGVISPTIFASEYSFHTYKNMIPFVSRKKIFWSKFLAMFTGIWIVLLVDMFLELGIASVVTRDFPDIQDFAFSILRYSNIFLMLLLVVSLLTLFCLLVQKRALANVATVCFSLGLYFIPADFKGTALWDLWVDSLAWGSMINMTVFGLIFIISAFIISVSLVVFQRQEVRL